MTVGTLFQSVAPLPGREMYLRFVMQNPISHSEFREGIFAAAYDLKVAGRLSSEDEHHLTQLLQWFEHNLAVPTKFNRTRSKGYYRRATKGIAWFKSSATTHLERIHELAELLDRYDVRSEVVMSERPGYIVYEDNAQVIAEPFRDTQT
jgi:hypothetical protein